MAQTETRVAGKRKARRTVVTGGVAGRMQMLAATYIVERARLDGIRETHGFGRRLFDKPFLEVYDPTGKTSSASLLPGIHPEIMLAASSFERVIVTEEPASRQADHAVARGIVQIRRGDQLFSVHVMLEFTRDSEKRLTVHSWHAMLDLHNGPFLHTEWADPKERIRQGLGSYDPARIKAVCSCLAATPANPAKGKDLFGERGSHILYVTWDQPGYGAWGRVRLDYVDGTTVALTTSGEATTFPRPCSLRDGISSAALNDLEILAGTLAPAAKG